MTWIPPSGVEEQDSEDQPQRAEKGVYRRFFGHRCNPSGASVVVMPLVVCRSLDAVLVYPLADQRSDRGGICVPQTAVVSLRARRATVAVLSGGGSDRPAGVDAFLDGRHICGGRHQRSGTFGHRSGGIDACSASATSDRSFLDHRRHAGCRDAVARSDPFDTGPRDRQPSDLGGCLGAHLGRAPWQRGAALVLRYGVEFFVFSAGWLAWRGRSWGHAFAAASIPHAFINLFVMSTISLAPAS